MSAAALKTLRAHSTAPMIVGDAQADAALLLLHGLGASADDLAPLAEQLCAARPLFCALPNAPVRAVTINGGAPMRAWHDIEHANLAAPHRFDGLESSAALLRELLELLRDAGFAPRRTIIAGFSQGGAMSLYVALGGDIKPLAGAACLSGYWPSLAPPPVKAGKESPSIFLAHGAYDPVVPPLAADMAVRALEESGHQPRRFDYQIMHAICPEEMDDLTAWVNEVLPAV